MAMQTEGRRLTLSRRTPHSDLWLVGWLVGTASIRCSLQEYTSFNYTSERSNNVWLHGHTAQREPGTPQLSRGNAASSTRPATWSATSRCNSQWPSGQSQPHVQAAHRLPQIRRSIANLFSAPQPTPQFYITQPTAPVPPALSTTIVGPAANQLSQQAHPHLAA